MGTIVLASRSLRRKQLLIEAGFDVAVHAPDVDDGLLRKPLHVQPRQWVQALAWMKAQSVWRTLRASQPGADILVLAADTICVLSDGSTILGQPQNAHAARAMIVAMSGDSHVTMTGVCMLANRAQALFTEEAAVEIGPLASSDIEDYISSNNWQGKAGGYNLTERQEAGWPIAVRSGDPLTVVGLPMQRLQPLLAKALRQSVDECNPERL
ncbi:MAG: Maf family protein [Phycisphaerales bacterium]